MSVRIEQSGEDVLIWIKAVPGASRDEVAGAVGDRLKVRVSAPPEDGKANKAICVVVARMLGVKKWRVRVASGKTSAEKVLRVSACRTVAVAQLIT